MKGIFVALTAILPLAVAAPFGLEARDANPGCYAKSFRNPEWTIEDFDFHSSYVFTTPAHQNSWGFVSFNMTNPALEYKASCVGSSSQLSDFFYGTMKYQCTVPGNATAVSVFTFDRASGKLDLSEAWKCSDFNPKYPTKFRAYGTTNLTLSCKDETWENPDWHMGQIYSSRTVTCDKVTVQIKPNRIEAFA